MAVPPVCVLIGIPSLARLKAAGLAERLILYVESNIPDPVPILFGHLHTVQIRPCYISSSHTGLIRC